MLILSEVEGRSRSHPPAPRSAPQPTPRSSAGILPRRAWQKYRRGDRGGRSIAKRPEPAQQTDLLLAEPRDVDERLRPAQHRQQAQQQHLVERINDFAALPKIRKIFEIIQKNTCFDDRSKFRRRLLRRVLRKTKSEDHDRFNTSSLCHALLHPIALSARRPGLARAGARR